MRKLPYVLCSLFILLWSTASAAIYIPGLGPCQERLVRPSVGEGPPDPATGPTLTYEVAASSGEVIGRLTVTLSVDRRSITAADGEVLPPHQRNGVYRALVAQLMADQPQVRTVDAQLNGANLIAYKEALPSHSDHRRTITVDERNAAVRETPLFKVFAPFGFTDIQVVVLGSGEEVFAALSRPVSESPYLPADSPMRF
jgi:hypothetical protein